MKKSKRLNVSKMIFDIHLTSFSQAKSLLSSSKAGVEERVPESVIYWRSGRNTFTACSKKKKFNQKYSSIEPIGFGYFENFGNRHVIRWQWMADRVTLLYNHRTYVKKRFPTF